MASKLPSIPTQTERNVKMMLDTLAGRLDPNKKALNVNDLVNLGLISADGARILQKIPPAFGQDDIIFPEIPTGFLPDAPTVPTKLSATTGWASVFLDWEYEPYNAEGGTEIWRSRANDRNTAARIATANGRTYTDNIGKRQTYFYWIRNRNISGEVSGFNRLAGVQGSSNLILTAQDFFLDNPEAEEELLVRPFYYVDYSVPTPEEPDPPPDWKMLLDAQIIITGDLSIGQLASGELRPNTTLTIGNGSIVLGTDSELGLGSILIAGDGGEDKNDYMRLTDGSIESYIYEDGKHKKYKELKRVVHGVCNGGPPGQTVQVAIDGYFKSAPAIYLSPKNVSVYNADYSDQSQSLIVAASDPQPVLNKPGYWVFYAMSYLELGQGLQSTVINEQGSTTYNTPVVITPNDDDEIHQYKGASNGVVKVNLQSQRLYDVSNQQQRVTLVQVYAAPIGTFNFNNEDGMGGGLIATESIEHGKTLAAIDTTVNFQFAYVGDWRIRVVMTSSDSAQGVWPVTNDVYTYYGQDPQGKVTVTSGHEFTAKGNVADGKLDGQFIQCAPPPAEAINNFDLYQIKYTFKISYNLKIWLVRKDSALNYGNSGVGEISIGHAAISVPNWAYKDLTNTYSSSGDYPPYVCGGYPQEHTSRYREQAESNIQAGHAGVLTALNPTLITQFEQGFWVAPNVGSGVGVGYTVDVPSVYDPNSTCSFGTSKAEVTISDYSVDYYYRRLNTPSTVASNTHKLLSSDVVLEGRDISLRLSTLNWTAVGE